MSTEFSTDYWEVLNKNYVIDSLSQKGLSYESAINALEFFVEVLNNVEDSEKTHITNHLNESMDVRSAALCYEAMGAFQLLKNKISGENVD